MVFVVWMPEHQDAQRSFIVSGVCGRTIYSNLFSSLAGAIFRAYHGYLDSRNCYLDFPSVG